MNVGSNINDNSLVVRMDCGESSFLFAGDAETSSENEMILLGRDLDRCPQAGPPRLAHVDRRSTIRYVPVYGSLLPPKPLLFT